MPLENIRKFFLPGLDSDTEFNDLINRRRRRGFTPSV